MEPSFDFWSVVFLIAAAQGAFLSTMLFVRGSKTNNLLALLILSFSLCLGFYVAFWTGYSQIWPWQLGAAQGLTMTFGPLTYFYLRSDRKNFFVNYWHFIPFIAYLGLYIFGLPARLISGTILAIAQIIHLGIYTYLIFEWLSRNVGYSNGALKRYKWQRKVAFSFLGYSVSFLLYYVLVWTGLLKIEYDYMISIASSFLIYFIGYHGFQKQEVLRMNENNRYDKSSLSETASQSIMKRLNEIMESEKLYRQSSLKLQEVADRLGLQPHLVSQVINEVEEKHFSDYVNSFRVTEAKHLLITTDHKVIHVAYDTGFNNKASFNNAFKKFAGMSPSEYRNLQAISA